MMNYRIQVGDFASRRTTKKYLGGKLQITTLGSLQRWLYS